MKNNRVAVARQNRFLITLLVSVGVILLSAAFFLSFSYSLTGARSTMERNIRDLKKQCGDYSDFLASDEAKSLIHLTELADAVSSSLPMVAESERDSFLRQFYDRQRLDCLLILDDTLKPDFVYPLIGMSYDGWKNEIESSAVSAVLSFPKKIYSSRITHSGATYDIAAAARQDKKGIVFCAVLQGDEQLKFHYSPIRSLLARTETDLKGSLFITEGNTVVASNTGKNESDKALIPELASIDAIGNGTRLTRFRCGGKVYYGGNAKYRNYEIYAFYPSPAVFVSVGITMLVAFCIYLLFASLLIIFHLRSRSRHSREIAKQYEIIKSISHIYTMTVLVDVKNQSYTLLKRPDDCDNVPITGPVNDETRGALACHVGKKYRGGFQRFFDAATLNERLGCADYIEYDYKDVKGEWLNDKIILHSRDKSGVLSSFILARKNISAQKKSELEYHQKLETAIKNEQEANQSKTEFLRSISHDIRTPINVMLGMLEIADRNKGNTEVLVDCRKKIRAAAEYLLDLVNDILTLNKKDDGSADKTAVQTAFILSEELQKLYLIVSERAKTNAVRLDPPQISVSGRALLGNPLYLRQIMINIITNAIKYNGENGTVKYSVSETPDEKRDGFAAVHFVCEDNGIGMSREFQKKMFEPFAQENDFVVSKTGGIGLGLSIVKKLVKELGGTISADSEKNKGTRFEITIPYQYSAVLSTAADTESIASIKGLTVLLAEDNELNMEIAEYILTDAGARVIKAYTGKEALELFKNSAHGEIDVILTDLSMPVMDGLEEAREIRLLDRDDAKKIPIIAMTANLFDDDKKACADAGMTGFIPKPFNINELLYAISKQASDGK